MKKVDSNLKINGEITYYDFAPTILDMIGIYQYEPEFPFGRVFYRNTLNNHQKYCTSDICILKHPKPNVDDLAFLYKFIHFEQWNNPIVQSFLSALSPICPLPQNPLPSLTRGSFSDALAACEYILYSYTNYSCVLFFSLVYLTDLPVSLYRIRWAPCCL